MSQINVYKLTSSASISCFIWTLCMRQDCTLEFLPFSFYSILQDDTGFWTHWLARYSLETNASLLCTISSFNILNVMQSNYNFSQLLIHATASCSFQPEKTIGPQRWACYRLHDSFFDRTVKCSKITIGYLTFIVLKCLHWNLERQWL